MLWEGGKVCWSLFQEANPSPSAASAPTLALSWLLPLWGGSPGILCASPTSSSHSSPVSPQSLHSAHFPVSPFSPQPPLNSQQHSGPHPTPTQLLAALCVAQTPCWLWFQPPGSSRTSHRALPQVPRTFLAPESTSEAQQCHRALRFGGTWQGGDCLPLKTGVPPSPPRPGGPSHLALSLSSTEQHSLTAEGACGDSAL